jgi:hypothetical protein
MYSKVRYCVLEDSRVLEASLLPSFSLVEFLKSKIPNVRGRSEGVDEKRSADRCALGFARSAIFTIWPLARLDFPPNFDSLPFIVNLRDI